MRLDCRVASLDRGARAVVLADGERVAYDSLVLATGGRVRPMPVPGAELAGVAYVRTLADAKALKPQIEAAKQRGGDRRRLHRPRMRVGRFRARLQGGGAGGDGAPDGARGVAGAVRLLPRPASLPRRRRAARRVGDGDRRRRRPRDRRALRRRFDRAGRSRGGRHRHHRQRRSREGGGAHLRPRHRGRRAAAHRRSGYLCDRRLRGVSASDGAADWCGSSRCRTPSTRARPSPTRSWATPSPMRRCRGSGPTSTR